MLRMTSRTRALVTFGGVATSFVAAALFGIGPAGMVALATLWFAASGPSIVGASPAASSAALAEVEPRAVRRYREEHPGATIREAMSAVERQ